MIWSSACYAWALAIVSRLFLVEVCLVMSDYGQLYAVYLLTITLWVIWGCVHCIVFKDPVYRNKGKKRNIISMFMYYVFNCMFSQVYNQLKTSYFLLPNNELFLSVDGSGLFSWRTAMFLQYPKGDK